jgi:hypothetical protein
VNPESEQEAYDQLAFYTLSLGDSEFIHQHIVDAFGAQQANNKTKPIALAFALIGLYLCVDKGYSGRQVQDTHVRLAKRRRNWPAFPLPAERGHIRASDVLAAQPGDERDAMILKWCESVWAAYNECHGQVAALYAAAFE